eukprot:95292-Chlamydomonas_euryale.AAC.1
MGVNAICAGVRGRSPRPLGSSATAGAGFSRGPAQQVLILGARFGQQEPHMWAWYRPGGGGGMNSFSTHAGSVGRRNTVPLRILHKSYLGPLVKALSKILTNSRMLYIATNNKQQQWPASSCCSSLISLCSSLLIAVAMLIFAEAGRQVHNYRRHARQHVAQCNPGWGTLLRNFWLRVLPQRVRNGCQVWQPK